MYIDKREAYIDRKIEEIYNNVIATLNKVVEEFNDFYDERNVDLQNVISLREFKPCIKTLGIGSLINPDYKYIIDAKLGNYYNDCFTYEEINDMDLLDVRLPITICSYILDIYNCNVSLMSKILTNRVPSPYILIYFDSVKITNEFNRSTIIKKLYCKVDLFYNGHIKSPITFNRAEYTKNEYDNNYMHSHIKNIPKFYTTEFQSSCLGTGPIIDTITNLQYNTDPIESILSIWKLFCVELKKYVQTESLYGGPFHKMSHLKFGNLRCINTDENHIISYYTNMLNNSTVKTKKMYLDFLTYFFKNIKFKYNYNYGKYGISMSFTEIWIMISNMFIKWYNDNKHNDISYNDLLLSHFLNKYILIDDKVCIDSNNNATTTDIDSINSLKLPICTFKGKPITLTITKNDNKTRNDVVLLDSSLIKIILEYVYMLINYNYKRENENREITISKKGYII